MKRKKHAYTPKASSQNTISTSPMNADLSLLCVAASSATPARPSTSAMTARRSSPVRNTSAASALFTAGDNPYKNEMCATDVCCAATEKITVMNGPNKMPAMTTATQRRTSSRGGDSRHAMPSATRQIGSAHAARATATVMPSNVPGSAANSALLAGPSKPQPKPMSTMKTTFCTERGTFAKPEASALGCAQGERGGSATAAPAVRIIIGQFRSRR